jgi:hypothetical protein
MAQNCDGNPIFGRIGCGVERLDEQAELGVQPKKAFFSQGQLVDRAGGHRTHRRQFSMGSILVHKATHWTVRTMRGYSYDGKTGTPVLESD